MEQRNLLLSRTRRGANKKSKGGNSKKDSKSQKPKKSKNSSKLKNEAERISSRRPSKEQPKKTGKPSKGGQAPSGGQNAAGRISGKQKNRPEDFKSCTATMITPKCILTTAACTGKSKNVNLFAKIGERQYGSDVSFSYATVKILFVQYIFTIPVWAGK